MTKHPLLKCVYYIIIKERELHKKLGFKENVFNTFIYRIENEYCDVEYHNNTHALDVFVTLNYFLNKCIVVKNNFVDIDILTILIAAIIHDVKHNGRNNNFHIQTRSKIALTYNDQSPLENYHISTAFNILYRTDSNFLHELTKVSQQQIREIIIKVVLKTDMSLHKQNINTFVKFLESVTSKDTKKINLNELKLNTYNNSNDTPRCPGIFDEKLLVMETLLHLSDISNTSKPFNLALKWGKCVYQEFYCQGDDELNLGLPVSPLCNRKNSNFIEEQIAFAKFVVGPYVKLSLFLFPELKIMNRCLQENIKTYEKLKSKKLEF